METSQPSSEKTVRVYLLVPKWWMGAVPSLVTLHENEGLKESADYYSVLVGEYPQSSNVRTDVSGNVCVDGTLVLSFNDAVDSIRMASVLRGEDKVIINGTMYSAGSDPDYTPYRLSMHQYPLTR